MYLVTIHRNSKGNGTTGFFKMGKLYQLALYNRGLNTKNCMKRCSSSLVIKEMKIKMTMNYYHTRRRTAKIFKAEETKC